MRASNIVYNSCNLSGKAIVPAKPTPSPPPAKTRQDPNIFHPSPKPFQPCNHRYLQCAIK